MIHRSKERIRTRETIAPRIPWLVNVRSKRHYGISHQTPETSGRGNYQEVVWVYSAILLRCESAFSRCRNGSERGRKK